MKKIELVKLIESINLFDETYYIIFKNNKLQINSACVLTDEEEINEDEENIVIGVYQLRDVIENLRLQKTNFTIEEVINALNFYIENNAFIEIKNLL